jgi:hypothetical protein
LTLHTIWLVVLTIALLAHMAKDAREFKKLQDLEKQLAELKSKT